MKLGNYVQKKDAIGSRPGILLHLYVTIKNQCKLLMRILSAFVSVEYIFVAWNCYYAQLVATYEVGNLVAFGRWFHVVLDAAQCVEHRSVALVNMTVCLGNVVDDFVGEAFVPHYVGVNAVVADGVVCHDDERRHIAVDAASTFYHSPFADFAVRVQHCRGAEYDACANFAVVCYVASVPDNYVIADLSVVHDVRFSHYEDVAADACSRAVVNATVDDGVLAYAAAVTDDNKRRVAFPAQVLWFGADNGTVVNFAIVANASAVEDTHKWVDGAIVANLDILADEREWVDGYVFSQFSFGVNVC